MGKREQGPRHKPGLWPTQKRARSCARNPTLTGFLERTQNLRCADLPLSGFIESAQSLAFALIRRTFYALERRTTHSSEWEGTQTLRRERQAHRWPSYGEGSNAGSTNKATTYHRALGGGETRTLRRERHAHRWPSMVRGAMLARPTRRATYHRALGSGELIPQNEKELRRSAGSGMLINNPL